MNKEDNINLTALQNFLDEKGIQIPIIKKNPKTFLGIAKQPHYENVLSNILAFYFDVTEEHGLDDLFISSFQEIINKKTNKDNISLNDFEIRTEFTTNKNGRIDILLQSNKQAIIIENKVYHHLNNDLDDYWDSIDKKDKVGVVLSLKPQAIINHKDFINISHFDFLKTVIKNLPNYQTETLNKYIVFVEDLYQNIKNLSNKNMTKEEIEFYLKNSEHINKAKELYFNTRDYIKYEVENAGYTIPNLNKYNPKHIEKRGCYYVCPTNKNLMFTIIFGQLLSAEKRLLLIVELQNGLTQNKEQYKSIVFNTEEEKLLTDHFYTDNKNWVHYAVKEFKLEEVDMLNLSDFIQKELALDKPIRSIYEKLNKEINTK